MSQWFHRHSILSPKARKNPNPLTFDTSVLFELISHRYEFKSLLITSNQTFSAWDSIFADATMTVAAVDRLVHHATIIELSQDSFRKKSALSRSHFRDSDEPT